MDLSYYKTCGGHFLWEGHIVLAKSEPAIAEKVKACLGVENPFQEILKKILKGKLVNAILWHIAINVSAKNIFKESCVLRTIFNVNKVHFGVGET